MRRGGARVEVREGDGKMVCDWKSRGWTVKDLYSQSVDLSTSAFSTPPSTLRLAFPIRATGSWLFFSSTSRSLFISSKPSREVWRRRPERSG